MESFRQEANRGKKEQLKRSRKTEADLGDSGKMKKLTVMLVCQESGSPIDFAGSFRRRFENHKRVGTYEVG